MEPKNRINELLRTGDNVSQALLKQASDPHSGAFLTAKPAGCTELSDEAFTTTLRLRLGLDQLPSGCRCMTHECEFDSRGHHALSCQNFQGSVHCRRDLIRYQIFSFCKLLDGGAQLGIEQSAPPALDDLQSLDRDGLGTEQRASGRTIPVDIALRLSRDEPSRSFYDITVVNCLTPQALAVADGTSSTEGFQSVLRTAFNKMIAKHEADMYSAFSSVLFHSYFRPPAPGIQTLFASFERLLHTSQHAAAIRNRRAGGFCLRKLVAKWPEGTLLSCGRRSSLCLLLSMEQPNAKTDSSREGLFLNVFLDFSAALQRTY